MEKLKNYIIVLGEPYTFATAGKILWRETMKNISIKLDKISNDTYRIP